MNLQHIALIVYDIVAKSQIIYREEALMLFLTDLHVSPLPVCVTYFDEAYELGIQFQILMHLLSHQCLVMKMWYVFMGTKLSISYFSPSYLILDQLSTADCGSTL